LSEVVHETAEYGSAARVAEMLNISCPSVRQLADRGIIGFKQIPTMPRKYRLDDVRRLIVESERPAVGAGK
jgi:hypothetical protein